MAGSEETTGYRAEGVVGRIVEGGKVGRAQLWSAGLGS